MTYDRTLFKDLNISGITKVRNGNSKYISAKGNGSIAISINSGTKTISNVLYVTDIDHNLLSIGQLIEKGYEVSSKYNYCFTYDSTSHEILRVMIVLVMRVEDKGQHQDRQYNLRSRKVIYMFFIIINWSAHFCTCLTINELHDFSKKKNT